VSDITSLFPASRPFSTSISRRNTRRGRGSAALRRTQLRPARWQRRVPPCRCCPHRGTSPTRALTRPGCQAQGTWVWRGQPAHPSHRPSPADGRRALRALRLRGPAGPQAQRHRGQERAAGRATPAGAPGPRSRARGAARGGGPLGPPQRPPAPGRRGGTRHPGGDPRRSGRHAAPRGGPPALGAARGTPGGTPGARGGVGWDARLGCSALRAARAGAAPSALALILRTSSVPRRPTRARSAA
jgi:hypothetical protein